MKVPMFVMVAGAAIAFAAPSANARAVKVHHAPVLHKIAKSKKSGKSAKVAKSSKTTGSRAVTPKQPVYIYIPSLSGAPAVSTDPTDPCIEYWVDCTDQQLCDNGGLSCSTAGGQSGSSQPAASDTTGAAAQAPTQTQSESQPADSSVTASEGVSAPATDAMGTLVDASSDDC